MQKTEHPPPGPRPDPAGRLIDRSRTARLLYSQDASLYQELPAGVCFPSCPEDARALLAWASDSATPLIARGGGTSLAGQCVGDGVVVDFSRHMHRILSIDPDCRRAVVQPGVIQDDLNDAVRAYGLKFPPDTSTSRQANIGGMIGNNSSGSFSVRFGTTRDHVEALDLLLADGTSVRAEPLPDSDYRARAAADTREGALLRGIESLIGENREAILREYPDPRIVRRNTGYALDEMARRQPFDPEGPPFSLVPLICGSEGTLALFTEADLRLSPLHRDRIVLVPHFESVEEACEAVPLVLESSPAAVELIDRHVMEAARRNREQAGNRQWIDGDPAAVLIIELQDNHGGDNLAERAHQLEQALGRDSARTSCPVLKAGDAPRAWAVRKAGLGLLASTPGDAKPVTMIEDLAVLPSDLASFVRDIRALLGRHGFDCVYYGHASVGLLHLRPLMNLKDPDHLEHFRRILEESADLVHAYGGSLSGEHGDGRLRAPYHDRVFSTQMIELQRKVKDLFDPHHLLNPHKIVDPRPADIDLRAHPESRTPEIDTEFDWSDRHGLVRAVEACNGTGVCRQSAGRGTMCPTYMATGREGLSTRGRANVLRHLLTAPDPDAAWTSPDVWAVLDSCISCKGCATECPSSVDMARIKAEVQQKRIDREGASLGDRVFGHYAFGARLARPAPRLATAVANLPPVKRLLGIAPERPVPAFARTPFSKWWTRREAPAAPTRGEIGLYIDEFTEYAEPEVGMAAVAVLERAGYGIRILGPLDSGRTQMSKGFVRGARSCMETALDVLGPAADAGLPIVGLEPSALLGFRDEAPELVRPAWRDRARRVARSARLFEEWITEEHERGRLHDMPLAPLSSPHILVHGHCHQKALAGASCTVNCLKLIPDVIVELLPTGCCGMAGSFGYLQRHYRLSMEIADMVLFPALRDNPDALLCAPGMSCRHQVLDGLNRPAYHPAQLLARALT